MKRSNVLLIAAIAAIVIPAALAQAGKQDPKPKEEPKPAAPVAAPAKAGGEDAKTIQRQLPSYPLTTCPISGKPLGEKPVDHVVKGRLVRLCCERCPAKVDADPTESFKKIDEAVIAAQKKDYPMKESPVSGEKLGDKSVDYVHGTRLVRLASREEIPAFEKDAKGAMAKLDKAYIAAQLPSYALKKCPVSGEALGMDNEAPVDYLYGTRLVRFCCKNCIRDFERTPDKYMKELQ